MALKAFPLNGTYTPKELRHLWAGGHYAHAADSITVVPGVVVGFGVTGLVGAQVTVRDGIAVISPSDGVRGSYLFSSDAQQTISLTPADSVYPRVDAIILRVYDTAYGDATTGPAIEKITGTPAVSPVAPPTPAGSLLLAHVTVPQSPLGAASAAADRRLWTSAIGGAMSGTRAQREALPTTHLRPGQAFTENADSPAATPPGKKGQTWQWNGAGWTPQFVTGFRAYIGQVMRPFSWDYRLTIPNGNVYALPLRKATGAGFDERNNLPCTVVNGTNIQVPYAGRYRLRASVAADAKGTYGVDAEFILAIRLNVNAASGSPATNLGPIGGATAGSILDEQPKYMGNGATYAIHTMHTVEVPHYELAAGDTICVTLWQNSSSSKELRYENPFISYLDITRLGD